MAYRTYECPNEACDFEEVAGKPPHHNPCPQCRQVGGFLRLKESKKRGK
jgi:hypothetical protein